MKKGINDMNQQLPAYLRMQTHAHARPDQSIVCGQVRVTVITPCLIRFEEDAWTDDATLTVTARDLGECTVRTEVQDDRTVICTDMGGTFFQIVSLFETIADVRSSIKYNIFTNYANIF